LKNSLFGRSTGSVANRSSRNVLAAAAGAILLLASGAALAQSPPEGPPQPDLSRLHDALRLGPAQEAAWKAYAAAITPDPQLEARRRGAAAMMKSLPTPRRIDLVDAEMQEEMAAMRRQGQAVKAFYAQLSPEQQKTFDEMTYQSPEDQEDR
jgi:hypothetical protein